jgi:hypothetical protein
MFAQDAVLEHPPLQRQQEGGGGYLLFAAMWLRAFPDARITVEHVSRGTDGIHDVELLAHGTHLGPLDLGGGGLFKPTGVVAALRLRQLLQFRDHKVIYSSLSFDLLDIVQQLVTVDVPQLLDHLRRVRQLGEKLAAIPTEEVVERLNVLQRLGPELDAARHVLRPYFKR